MSKLSKKQCLEALDDIKFLGSINIPISSIEIIEELINEHFDNQPLKFEELNENVEQLEKQLNANDKALDIACRKLAYINSFCSICEEYRCNRDVCDGCCNNECDNESDWKEWSEHGVKKIK
ncbi:MAG: hypothetical protein PHC62_03960 [Candidatus Izemoplasmatales bacterium]|nr:hypothetical protein [Candidatus Izemoplasmatales bacterium]